MNYFTNLFKGFKVSFLLLFIIQIPNIFWVTLNGQTLPTNCTEYIVLVSELNANPNTTLYDYNNPGQQIFNSCIGPGLGGGEGIAVDPNSKRIYIADIDDGTIEVWDGTTQQLVQEWANHGPLDISLSLDYQILYAISYNVVRAFNAFTGTEISSCDLNAYNSNGGLWGVAQSPINGYLYITYGWNSSGSTGILVVNPADCQVVNQIATANTNSGYPYGYVGLAMDSDGSFWVVRNNLNNTTQDYLMHFDATGNLLGQCPLTGSSFWDISIGPDSNLYITSYENAEVIKVDRNNCTQSNFIDFTNESAKGIAFGCRDVLCDVPCPVINVSSTIIQPTCTTPTGSIDATASGGVAPYTFTWSNGENNVDYTHDQIGPLAPGNYQLIVKDANMCQTTVNYVITEATNCGPICTDYVGNVNVTQPTCTNPSGSATASAVGGVGPHTYLWSTGATTATISNLIPGGYSVTIMDSQSPVPCSTSLNVLISAPTNCCTAFSAVTNTTQPTCSTPTGSISVTTSGGITPYTYLWSNGATTSTISDLAPGLYSVTVSDSSNPKCTTTKEETLSAPIGCCVNFAASTNATQPTCTTPTGSISVTPSGGLSPYTYIWSNGATTSSISNLTPANYVVTVRDSQVPACEIINTISITAPQNCPTPCALTITSSGPTTAGCDPATNKYVMEVSVSYSGIANGEGIMINGQLVTADGSGSQTFVLPITFDADGQAEMVTAVAANDPTCSDADGFTFTAPAPCAIVCPVPNCIEINVSPGN